VNDVDLKLAAEQLKYLQYLLDLLMPAFAFVIWWLWRMLVASVKQNAVDCDKSQKELLAKFNDHRVYIAEKYVTNDDLKEVVVDLKQTMGDLRETISGVHRRFDEFFKAITPR